MIFAGDIGGTKTNLALFDHKDPNKFHHFATFHSGEYPDLQSIVLKYLKENPFEIEGGCLAIAGPVIDGICKVTNLPWTVSIFDLRKATKIDKLFLINDLEANAYALEVLDKSALVTLHQGEEKKGNRAVISPGTGLGEAGIIRIKGEWHPFASEGGHSDFGPTTEIQMDLAKFYFHKMGHFSYDRLLSGPGLLNIYQFFVEFKKREVPEWLQQEIKEEGAAAITKHGLNGESSICEESLDLYVEIFGQEAGNAALKFLAVGGLYLGGGISPKILPKLQEKNSPFLKGYLNKGRFSSFLENIPVHVILDDTASLKGSNVYARKNH